MTAPATVGIVRQLSTLARELDDTVSALESADMTATKARLALDLAFSRAFVAEQGSVDLRKHLAVIATAELRDAADVADTVVRHLRRRVDAIRTRIEVGRSLGAAVRAEAML